jgi:hypothetical protein
LKKRAWSHDRLGELGDMINQKKHLTIKFREFT